MATASKVLDIPNHTARPISRVVMTEGGKGGTGKTAFASLLVERYAADNLPHTLLDLDTENKSKGSLAVLPQGAEGKHPHVGGLRFLRRCVG
jgi:Mrp family chromosome partitioning ATPase